MTEDERFKCGIFVRSLSLLKVDDDGLTDDNDMDDLEAISQVCPEVKAITSTGESPYELALHRVATLTEQVLLTWARPDRKAVKGWLIARGELLVLQIPHV